jgi:hypothetical protein
METALKELVHSYKELSDEELLNLHSSGGLTEVAYSALEMELSRREIPVPERTAEEVLSEADKSGVPISLQIAVWLMVAYGIYSFANLAFRANASPYMIGAGIGSFISCAIIVWLLYRMKKYGWSISVFLICGAIYGDITKYGNAFHLALLLGALVALLMPDSRSTFKKLRQTSEHNHGY